MNTAPRSLPQIDAPAAGPPLWLPLAFFAQAILWLLATATGLAGTLPDLLAGLVYAPRVLAVTHGFTLGVVGSAIFGALHQFIPVVTGHPIRGPRVAVLTCWTWPLGVALLIGGLWWWSPGTQAVGWAVLFVAVGLASWNLLPARRRARQNRHVAGFVSLAHSALGLGMGLALVRIGDGLGWWHTSRGGLLAAHLHLGWIGFGTLTAVGVGSKMLPAFLALPDHADAATAPPPYRVIGWCLGLGLLAVSVGPPFGISWLSRTATVLLAAGTLLHWAVLVGYFRRRGVRTLDPSLAGVAVAVGSYGMAIVAGLLLAIANVPAGRWWAAYLLLAVVGWLVLLVVGVLHRIGPRLLTAWMARRRGGLSAARRGALTPLPYLAWAAVAGLGSGALLTAVGVGLAAPATAIMGAGLLLGGALAVAIQAARLWNAAR